MKSSTSILIIAVVAVLVLGAAGAWWFTSGQSDNASESTNTTSASTTNPTHEEHQSTPQPTSGTNTSPSPTIAPDGDVKSFTITGQNFTFNPQSITVNQGDTVRITFKSAGGTHDLVIDDYNIRTNIINGGQEQTVQFVADKAGSFEYYCSISNHRAMGMVGTMIVQ